MYTCAGTDSTNQLALKALLVRSQDVLKKFINDERLSGSCPLPRYRYWCTRQTQFIYNMIYLSIILLTIINFVKTLQFVSQNHVTHTLHMHVYPHMYTCMYYIRMYMNTHLNTCLHSFVSKQVYTVIILCSYAVHACAPTPSGTYQLQLTCKSMTFNWGCLRCMVVLLVIVSLSSLGCNYQMITSITYALSCTGCQCTTHFFSYLQYIVFLVTKQLQQTLICSHLYRTRMSEVSLVLKSVTILISALKDAQKTSANSEFKPVIFECLIRYAQ